MMFEIPRFNGTETVAERFRLICQVNRWRINFYMTLPAIAMTSLFATEPERLGLGVCIYVAVVGGGWLLVNRLARLPR